MLIKQTLRPEATFTLDRGGVHMRKVERLLSKRKFHPQYFYIPPQDGEELAIHGRTSSANSDLRFLRITTEILR